MYVSLFTLPKYSSQANVACEVYFGSTKSETRGLKPLKVYKNSERQFLSCDNLSLHEDSEVVLSLHKVSERERGISPTSSGKFIAPRKN